MFISHVVQTCAFLTIGHLTASGAVHLLVPCTLSSFSFPVLFFSFSEKVDCNVPIPSFVLLSIHSQECVRKTSAKKSFFPWYDEKMFDHRLTQWPRSV